MQKFLAFAQQTLARVPQNELLQNAQDGRLLLRFEATEYTKHRHM